MRTTRRLLIAAAVIGGLFLGGNAIAERVVEDRIADQAQRSFGAAARPSVQVDGFPLLINIWKSRIPRASLSGRDLVVEDLRIARAHIVLEQIRASLADITGGKPIRVGRGLATAAVTTENVNRYLRDRDHRVTVSIVPGKIVARGTVRGAGTGSAEGVPRVVGRLLVFRPDRVFVRGRALCCALLEQARRELSFEVDLPELPGGIRITAVELAQGEARFIARFQNATLDLSER